MLVALFFSVAVVCAFSPQEEVPASQQLDSLVEAQITEVDSLTARTQSIVEADSLDRVLDKRSTAVSPFEQKDLESFRNDRKYDYSETPTQRSWLDNILNWIYNLIYRFFSWLFGGEKAGEYLAVFLKVLPYLIAGLLIYLIARFFLKVNSGGFGGGRKSKNLVNLSEEERIIMEEDIESLIRQALESGDYRLAVRYQFLLCLKMLKEGEWIRWQPQKTNHDYIEEIENPELRGLMSQAVRIYDYIWYGDFPLDQASYAKAVVGYESLRTKLKTR